MLLTAVIVLKEFVASSWLIDKQVLTSSRQYVGRRVVSRRGQDDDVIPFNELGFVHSSPSLNVPRKPYGRTTNLSKLAIHHGRIEIRTRTSPSNTSDSMRLDKTARFLPGA